MKFFKSATIATVLSAVAMAASAQSFSDIYGRKLVNDQGVVSIFANGKMGGVFNGKDFKGRWWTEGGNFCREGSVDGKPFGPACQTIRMSNGKIIFTTVDGKRTTTYRIQ